MNDRKKLNVVHALRSLEFGGAEKMVLKLSSVQKISDEVSPRLACVKGEGELKEEAEEYGIPRDVIGLGGIRYISPICKLASLFRRLNPDIVHTHNLVSHVHAAPAARLLGIPVIHTKHGRAVSSFSRFPWLRKWAYNLAARIAVVSDETGDNFTKESGVSPEKVVTIYNGIETELFAGKDAAEARKEFGAGSSDILFGSISRLSPEKDHATMIEAFSRVAASCGNCKLLIVGDGDTRRELERMVNDLSLGSKVIFAGFREDTAECLSAMDLFIQPSLEEGLSLTILEAAAAGVPIITTPVGGTPEILTDGVEGTMVEAGRSDLLASAMENFLEERDRFSRMAQAARDKVVQKFSLAAMARGYRKIYREVMSMYRR